MLLGILKSVRQFSQRVNLLLQLERFVAGAALLNLILVLFDLTYIPFRDFYLQPTFEVFEIAIELPRPPFNLFLRYDPVKGIEPYRDTQEYLDVVDRLQERISRLGFMEGAEAQEAQLEIKKILGDLCIRSVAIIDENPFQVANKSGDLERIKNRIREHVPNPSNSSKDSFCTFWSEDHLVTTSVNQEFAFFDREIRPLFARNYYRSIGETGRSVDYSWLYWDRWFFFLFGADFLLRTFWISRRRIGLSWLDGMLWRWYDILLLIPFWRGLRVIPTVIRLHQTKLFDLETARRQLSQGFVGSFAEDLTQVVVLQVLNQLQDGIRRGDLARQLLQHSDSQYVDLNQVDEIQELLSRFMVIFMEKALPQVRPDLEALLNYSITSALNTVPGYQELRRLPPFLQSSTQLGDRLTTQVMDSLFQSLTSAKVDSEGFRLARQLVNNLVKAVRTEAQQEHTLDEIQSLLADLLEELKVNYVQRLSQDDIEALLEETRKLRQVAQQRRQS